MGEILPCISRPARDHLAAEILADRLVAEADAEDGFLAREGADDVERHAGFAGRTRAGGEQHAVGVERQRLGRGDGVVAEDALLHPELPVVLDEVVSEGVEIINDQQHGGERRKGQASQAAPAGSRAEEAKFLSADF